MEELAAGDDRSHKYQYFFTTIPSRMPGQNWSHLAPTDESRNYRMDSVETATIQRPWQPEKFLHLQTPWGLGRYKLGQSKCCKYWSLHRVQTSYSTVAIIIHWRVRIDYQIVVYAYHFRALRNTPPTRRSVPELRPSY